MRLPRNSGPSVIVVGEQRSSRLREQRARNTSCLSVQRVLSHRNDALSEAQIVLSILQTNTPKSAAVSSQPPIVSTQQPTASSTCTTRICETSAHWLPPVFYGPWTFQMFEKTPMDFQNFKTSASRARHMWQSRRPNGLPSQANDVETVAPIGANHLHFLQVLCEGFVECLMMVFFGLVLCRFL
jgi:hypothetical protein